MRLFDTKDWTYSKKSVAENTVRVVLDGDKTVEENSVVEKLIA